MTDHRPDASAAQASATTNEAFRAPSRDALSRATVTAAAERSEPTTSARGRSRATAMAIAPAPVPMSATGRRLVGPDDCEDGLDEVLGLRARDEGVRSDVEIERPELPASGEVGDRLTPSPSFHQRLEAFPGIRVEGCAGMREKPGAAAAEHVGEQDLRIETRGRARLSERRPRSGERPLDGDVPVAGVRHRAPSRSGCGAHHSSSVGPAPATRVWRIRRRQRSAS